MKLLAAFTDLNDSVNLHTVLGVWFQTQTQTQMYTRVENDLQKWGGPGFKDKGQ